MATMNKTPKQLLELSEEVDAEIRTSVSAFLLGVKGASEGDAMNQVGAIMAGMMTGVSRVLWSFKDDEETEADVCNQAAEMLRECFGRCAANELGMTEAKGHA